MLKKNDIILALHESNIDYEIIKTIINLLDKFAEAIDDVWSAECCCYNHEEAFYKAVQYLEGKEITGI